MTPGQVDEPDRALAEALGEDAFAALLANDSATEGTRLQLDLAPDKNTEEEWSFPQALVFLQWLLSGETQLVHHHHQRWTWQKLSN